MNYRRFVFALIFLIGIIIVIVVNSGTGQQTDIRTRNYVQLANSINKHLQKNDNNWPIDLMKLVTSSQYEYFKEDLTAFINKPNFYTPLKSWDGITEYIHSNSKTNKEFLIYFPKDYLNMSRINVIMVSIIKDINRSKGHLSAILEVPEEEVKLRFYCYASILTPKGCLSTFKEMVSEKNKMIYTNNSINIFKTQIETINKNKY
jgi:hypothetical protein